MGFAELLLLAVGLAADAFAVSVCKGLAAEKLRFYHPLLTGVWFGGFQALMPVLGFFLGSAFASLVESVDHWIAFGLLVLIGANMIKEAFDGKENKTSSSFRVPVMLAMAVATSIDAFAVGISLAMEENTSIALAALLIGAVTFLLSAVGCLVGHKFGTKCRRGAEVAGGAVLICLGIKILVGAFLQ